MAQVLSLISSKGGVGKSTSAINFSCALADMGLRVLVIDLDSQQSLSKFFNFPIRPTQGLLEFIFNKDTTVPVRTHIDNLDCIVNNDPREELNDWMKENVAGRFSLKSILGRIKDQYDIIILDTQGKDGRGQLQEMAIIASDLVIIGTTPDTISSQELFKSINIYNHVINSLNDIGLSHQPPAIKILINREDITLETKKIIAKVREEFSTIARHINVLKTTIPQRVVYKRAITEQVPAHRIEKNRDISSREAINIMESLIHEILPHYRDLSIVLNKKEANHE